MTAVSDDALLASVLRRLIGDNGSGVEVNDDDCIGIDAIVYDLTGPERAALDRAIQQLTRPEHR